MVRAFLLLLLLPTAALGGEKQIKILYMGGYDYTYSVSMLDPLEGLLRADPGQVQLEGVDGQMLWYSRGNYLLDVGSGTPRASLPKAGAIPISVGAQPILESNNSFLFIRDESDYPLLEKILEHSRDRSDDFSYAPRVRRVKGRRVEFTTAEGARRGVALGERAPGEWMQTIGMHYRLKVAGRSVRITLVTKPTGSPARTARAFFDRLKAVKDPVLPLNLGRVSLPPNYGADAETLLAPFLRPGLFLQAVAPSDLEYSWKALAEHSGLSPQGLRLLATNLRGKTPEAEAKILHSLVEEVGGLRVGLISLLPMETNSRLGAVGHPLVVEEPIAAAKHAIEGLRREGKVDLIVVVSHLAGELDGRLAQEVRDYDILLGNSGWVTESTRRLRLDLAGREREPNVRPALVAERPAYSYGEITLSFRDGPEGKELTGIEESSGPPDSEGEDPEMAELAERLLGRFMAGGTALLPDPRALFPDTPKTKPFFSAAEVWNLAAQIERSAAGTEVGLVRIQRLGSQIPGVVRETYLLEWLEPHDRIVRFTLPGAALRRLLKRRGPIGAPTTDDPPNYWREPYLGFAGVDEKGQVSGLPIRDSEAYSVAAPEGLLKQTDDLPELEQAQDMEPMALTLPGAVLERLRSAPIEPQALRDLMAGKTPPAPVWRLRLGELSLQVSNTHVAHNGPFTQVRDSRVQASDQLFVQGASLLHSAYYRGPLVWSSALAVDYGRVTVRPSGAATLVNETADNLSFSSELFHRARVLGNRGSLGPYGALSYDTEITKRPGIPLRRLVDIKAGGKLGEGRELRELYLGALAERDYSTPRPNDEFGYEAGLRWEAPLHGPVTARAVVAYREFLNSSQDTPDDLKRALDVDLRLGVPVVGRLNLSPFLKFYLFEGKVVRRTGYNILVGVALDYSRLWKPLY